MYNINDGEPMWKKYRYIANLFTTNGDWFARTVRSNADEDILGFLPKGNCVKMTAGSSVNRWENVSAVISIDPSHITCARKNKEMISTCTFARDWSTWLNSKYRPLLALIFGHKLRKLSHQLGIGILRNQAQMWAHCWLVIFDAVDAP